MCACTIGQMVFGLGQSAVQARTLVAIKHCSQQRQRQCVLRVSVPQRTTRARSDAWHLEAQRHVGLFGRGFEIQAAQAALRRLGARFSLRQLRAGDAAVVLFCHCAHRLRLHITRHHQRGIVGCVPAAVERAGIFGHHGF